MTNWPTGEELSRSGADKVPVLKLIRWPTRPKKPTDLLVVAPLAVTPNVAWIQPLAGTLPISAKTSMAIDWFGDKVRLTGKLLVAWELTGVVVCDVRKLLKLVIGSVVALSVAKLTEIFVTLTASALDACMMNEPILIFCWLGLAVWLGKAGLRESIKFEVEEVKVVLLMPVVEGTVVTMNEDSPWALLVVPARLIWIPVLSIGALLAFVSATTETVSVVLAGIINVEPRLNINGEPV